MSQCNGTNGALSLPVFLLSFCYSSRARSLRLIASLPRLHSLQLGRATALLSTSYLTRLSALTLCDAAHIAHVVLPAVVSLALHRCRSLTTVDVPSATHLSLSNCETLRRCTLPLLLTRLELLHCPRMRIEGALPVGLSFLSLSSMKLEPVTVLVCHTRVTLFVFKMISSLACVSFGLFAQTFILHSHRHYKSSMWCIRNGLCR